MIRSKGLLLSLTLFVGACGSPATSQPGEGRESIGSISSAVDGTDYTFNVEADDAANYTRLIAWIRSQLTDGFVTYHRTDSNGQDVTGNYRILVGNRAVNDGDADLLRIHLFWRGGSTVTVLMRRDNGYVIGYVWRGHNVTDPSNTLFSRDDHLYYTNDFALDDRQVTAMGQGGTNIPVRHQLPFGSGYPALTNAQNANVRREQVALNQSAILSLTDSVDTRSPTNRQQAQVILTFSLFFAEAARFYNIEEWIRDLYTQAYGTLNTSLVTETNDFALDGSVVRAADNAGNLATAITIGATVIRTMWMLQRFLAIEHVPKRQP